MSESVSLGNARPTYDTLWSDEFGDQVRVRADNIGSLRGLLYGLRAVVNILIVDGELKETESSYSPLGANVVGGLKYAAKHLAEAAEAEVTDTEDWLREYGVKAGACEGPKEKGPTANG